MHSPSPAKPAAHVEDRRTSPHDDPASAHDFKRAMRLHGSQVVIVTAGTGEALTGMTCTSLSSLSVSPPAVTLCVATSASIHPVMAQTRRFGISGLAPHHAWLADRFAGRDGSKGAERFTQGAWEALSSGAPVLKDATFALDCVVDSMIPWRTHAIVVGRVLAIAVAGGESLLHRDGAYAGAVPLTPASPPPRGA
ncbi:flavin reductase family protein [Salinarimonas ramus]|uniref:Flavin reductase n=1 Tax=Salinarimonas ramus TaxID=690164 RepID=A0A917Q491_9HYPH|nr:flavin reductase family protein [Salinarimonas ramus]GGK19491.1 flavin reductase [Salinarimonas ramus]